MKFKIVERSLPVRCPISSAVRFSSWPSRSKAMAGFDRVEVFALNIFDQRDFEQPIVRDVANHDRHVLESRQLRRTPAPLSGDQLVSVARAPDDQWLHDAVRADRLGQFRQALGLEDAPRLQGIGVDRIDAEALRVLGARRFIGRRRRDGRRPASARRGARSSPLPSTLRGFSVLFMVENLFCELDVAFRAFGAGIVGENRLAETGRLGQANASRNYGFEDLISEELLQIGCDLPGQVGPVVEHRQENAFDFEGVTEAVPDPVDRVHELRDTFEGEKLALNRHHDRIGGDQSIEGEKIQRGWAVDQDIRIVVPDRSERSLAAETRGSANRRVPDSRRPDSCPP